MKRWRLEKVSLRAEEMNIKAKIMMKIVFDALLHFACEQF